MGPVEVPADRSWVVFNLRPEARWSDGKPLTADDVVFSFNTLMKDGHPHFHAYYADVASVVAESPVRVKFTFKNANNREMPLIIGECSEVPLGSGDSMEVCAKNLASLFVARRFFKVTDSGLQARPCRD